MIRLLAILLWTCAEASSGGALSVAIPAIVDVSSLDAQAAAESPSSVGSGRFHAGEWLAPRKPTLPARKTLADTSGTEDGTSDRSRLLLPMAQSLTLLLSVKNVSALQSSRSLPCSGLFFERSQPLLI